MFISTAHAEGAAVATANASIFMSYLPIILVFAVFYFLIIRPQGKQAAAHAQMLSTLRRGDKVITTGGLHGEIDKAEEDTLNLKLAEGFVVTVERKSVAKLVEQASEKKDKKNKKGKAA